MCEDERNYISVEKNEAGSPNSHTHIEIVPAGLNWGGASCQVLSILPTGFSPNIHTL